MEDRMGAYKNRDKNDETARGKRREFAVSLRKDKRRQKLDKRRDMEELETFMRSDPSGIRIAELCPIIQDDSQPAEQFEALTMLRKQLATNLELPIQATIDCGVLPKLVEMLHWDHAPEVQYEAAWVLTNVSSGTPAQTAAVVHVHAAPPLCRLLSSPVDKVKDQACWCLGNIAGDGADLRDMLLQAGALEVFLNMLRVETGLELLRNVSWTISNFFRWKEKPVSVEYMELSLPYLCERLASQDMEVISNVCWAVCYIAETTEVLLDTILEQFGPIFMQLLALKDHDAQLPAIRTLGSISAGTDEQTQGVLQLGLLDVCPALLRSPKATVRKDTCWTLSNVCAGSIEQISQVLRSPLVPSLIERCVTHNEAFKVKLDAAWSLCNIISQGADEQAEYVVQMGGVIAITSTLLPTMDTRAVMVFLDALETALDIGERDPKAELEGNPVAIQIEENEGIARLDALVDSEDAEVAKKAQHILDNFYKDEAVLEGVAPTMADGGASYGFGLQPPPMGPGAAGAFNF